MNLELEEAEMDLSLNSIRDDIFDTGIGKRSTDRSGLTARR